MMKVNVIGPNLPIRGRTFHVHAAGCVDIGRKIAYRRADQVIFDADSRMEVTEAIYPPDEFRYDPTDPYERAPYIEDLLFFPCMAALS